MTSFKAVKLIVLLLLIGFMVFLTFDFEGQHSGLKQGPAGRGTPTRAQNPNHPPNSQRGLSE